MAEIPMEFRGTLYDLASKSARQVFLQGVAYRSDVGVGGGPIMPGDPPQIWGPTDPRPGYGLPEQPPSIWGPTDPRPGYGLPKPPEGYPEPPTEGVKPPPEGGGWGYHPDYGWGFFPMGQSPGPKA